MATLAETFDAVAAELDRPLTGVEMRLVEKMHNGGRDVAYIVEVLNIPEDPEPSDDELITTRYEATIAGPQDITGIWG